MFSKVLRRTHLYLALFLTPWVAMYAVSTFVMNHRTAFRGKPPAAPKWERVSEQAYEAAFPEGADKKWMARQILASLDLDGANQATLRDGVLMIQRMDNLRPVRITYSAEKKMLLVERQASDGAAALERLHRRRGYQQPYVLDLVWAAVVDAVNVSIVFWVLSGLWMWWEMRVTRAWGGMSLAFGCALFAVFLAVL